MDNYPTIVLNHYTKGKFAWFTFNNTEFVVWVGPDAEPLKSFNDFFFDGGRCNLYRKLDHGPWSTFIKNGAYERYHADYEPSYAIKVGITNMDQLINILNEHITKDYLGGL